MPEPSNDSIMDFVNAVADATAATESYQNGGDVTQVEVTFLWQKVILALDKLPDTDNNVQTRIEALSVIDALMPDY